MIFIFGNVVLLISIIISKEEKVNHIFLVLGMAGQSTGQGSQSNPLLGFLPLVLILVIMYFLMIRPQAKKQKEHRDMLNTIEKGDKVLTAGGIIGTVAGIKEKEKVIILKIAENVKIEISRGSVAQLLKKK